MSVATILVSGASGVVGYGVLKSLRQSGLDYRLIGTTIYDDSVAPAFCDVFEQAPMTNDAGYIDWLCGVIDKHKVDIIIPGIEADMQSWNQARQRIARTGVTLLLNNPYLIELCSDKWNFYQKLTQGGPDELAIESRLSGTFQELKDELGLPFLLKPRRGFASKGIVIVESEGVFAAHQRDLGEVLMVQPIVGSKEDEYTVSAFFDKDSNLLCSMALRRKLSKEGFTEKALVADLPGSREAMEELGKLLQPVGPTNFQFRVHDGRLKLLEINPRVSSATSIRTAFGYNESLMSVEYFLHGTVPTQPEIRSGYAVRYVEEKVFYDSDIV
jgi:carbamoyl-phosphate synthase large subunit